MHFVINWWSLTKCEFLYLVWVYVLAGISYVGFSKVHCCRVRSKSINKILNGKNGCFYIVEISLDWKPVTLCFLIFARKNLDDQEGRFKSASQTRSDFDWSDKRIWSAIIVSGLMMNKEPSNKLAALMFGKRFKLFDLTILSLFFPILEKKVLKRVGSSAL